MACRSISSFRPVRRTTIAPSRASSLHNHFFQRKNRYGANRRENHQRDRKRIAPLPIELRHLLEIHAVDRRNDGRWHEDDRDYREQLDDVVLSEVDAAERRVEQELHFLRLETRVLFHRLQIAQRRLYCLAHHRLQRIFGTPFRHQEEQKALDRHQAFAQVRDLFVLAAKRI